MPIIHATNSDQAYIDIIDWEDKRKSDPTYKLILCEGDSWFSIGGATSSILLELQSINEKAGDKLLLINCAYPGDTLRNMANVHNDPFFKRMLNPRYGTFWDAILISAGGNDLISSLDGGITVCQSENIINSYDSLFAYAASERQVCPIITHNYSLPNIEYRKNPWWKLWQLGPWIGPRLKKLFPAMSKEEHTEIVREYFTDLTYALQTVAESHPLKLLQAGKDYPAVTDWANEIHPSCRLLGYRYIAWAFYATITALDFK